MRGECSVPITDDELVERAKEARKAAVAPYTGFEVGAALLTDDGQVFTGCNIENVTYNLSLCAERLAIFKAISEGARGLVKIAVVTDTSPLAPPCGSCRQLIWEFAKDDVQVILSNLSGEVVPFTIKALFPEGFDVRFL